MWPNIWGRGITHCHRIAIVLRCLAWQSSRPRFSHRLTWRPVLPIYRQRRRDMRQFAVHVRVPVILQTAYTFAHSAQTARTSPASQYIFSIASSALSNSERNRICFNKSCMRCLLLMHFYGTVNSSKIAVNFSAIWLKLTALSIWKCALEVQDQFIRPTCTTKRVKPWFHVKIKLF